MAFGCDVKVVLGSCWPNPILPTTNVDIICGGGSPGGILWVREHLFPYSGVSLLSINWPKHLLRPVIGKSKWKSA